ncbi:hypothetical protein FXO37_25666 [Capsicum annuum]|nr:hypothetical protein FXO37_25666 [Capsicum annuum]
MGITMGAKSMTGRLKRAMCMGIAIHYLKSMTGRLKRAIQYLKSITGRLKKAIGFEILENSGDEIPPDYDANKYRPKYNPQSPDYDTNKYGPP